MRQDNDDNDDDDSDEAEDEEYGMRYESDIE